jgi:hypothetical protein
MPLEAPVTIATLLDNLLIFTIVLDPNPHTLERPSLLNCASRVRKSRFMLLILKSVLKAREHSILHPERFFGNAEVSGNPSALHTHGLRGDFLAKPTSGPRR